MNDTDKLLMMKEREDEGNYVKKKKVQYVTRPHASTVEVTIHNLKPEQPPNCSVLTSNGFACINVTLHIKVFSVRVQLFLFASCLCGRNLREAELIHEHTILNTKEEKNISHEQNTYISSVTHLAGLCLNNRVDWKKLSFAHYS